MNYSFILPGNKELSNLKIKITGKDPINQIENITNFDKIIKLENGEQMSKMIVGKALKNNDELIKDEKKEIEFAKKYQILSKNTALFAEILNEENQKSKLIKVNSVNSFDESVMKNKTLSNMNSIDMQMNMMQQQMMQQQMMNCCKTNTIKESSSPNSINQHNINSSNNNSSNFKRLLSKRNRNTNDDINLIMSQDIMDGYWDENDETKKIIDIITLDKFNEIKNKINTLNKGENEIKIIYTILVIYYLKTNLSEKIKDYRLVISKANKFLEENGIDYDDIISGIS